MCSRRMLSVMCARRKVTLRKDCGCQTNKGVGKCKEGKKGQGKGTKPKDATPRGVNSTLTSHACTRNFFSCAWLKVRRDSDVWIAALMCASSYQTIFTQLACHVQYTALPNWTPTATLLCSRFAEQCPFKGYEPNAPVEVSSEATLIVLPSQGAVSNLLVATLLLLSMRRRRVDWTWDGWPHHRFYRSERQVRAHSEFITQTENIRVHPSLTRVQAPRNR